MDEQGTPGKTQTKLVKLRSWKQEQVSGKEYRDKGHLEVCLRKPKSPTGALIRDV